MVELSLLSTKIWLRSEHFSMTTTIPCYTRKHDIIVGINVRICCSVTNYSKTLWLKIRNMPQFLWVKNLGVTWLGVSGSESLILLQLLQ